MLESDLDEIIVTPHILKKTRDLQALRMKNCLFNLLFWLRRQPSLTYSATSRR